jgi:hypothetical protein
MNILPYNRIAAVDYAHEWAFRRNPAYADFSEMGGDCSKEPSPKSQTAQNHCI